jgi:hypothetical protein
MAKDIKNVTIGSLRGGLVDNDPPISIAEDTCTLAENVEFFSSTLGERRQGCTAISLPTSITTDVNIQVVSWMGRHLPTNNLGDAELWVLGQSLNGSNSVLTRRNKAGWATIVPIDTITVTSGVGHRLAYASLHGKLFLAHKSAQDRLHVYDGSTLRRAGIAPAAAAPTGADSGGGGAYATTRYARVRFVKVTGSTVDLRSEPSPVFTIVPSGANASYTITRPAAPGESETHWEIELSTDNANFYRVSRIILATTTYVDSTAFATGYTSGTLSEDLTAYTVIPSGKFLTIDEDRLLIAGSWENSLYSSRLWWTPVLGSTGNGNDERLDMTVNPYIDLDGFEGGEITALSRAVNGYLYAFKFSHIYKVTRTGIRTNAYSAIALTKSRGALPGSLVEAVDENGNPAQYFLDPKVGPMRIGSNGLEWCGSDIINTWQSVNQSALVPAHGVFYQAKNQVHFWIAVNGSDYPNMKIIVHCDELSTSQRDGAKRGWVTVPVGDRIASAHCSTAFSDNIDSTDVRGQVIVPFIGKEQWSVSGSTIKDLVQRCDSGNTDAFTTGDTDAYYYARVRTKPFAYAGLLNKFGVMAGILMCETNEGAANNIYVRAIRDFEAEDLLLPVSVTDDRTEDIVIKPLDNLNMAEIRAIQLEFGDLDTNVRPTTFWNLHSFSMKIRSEQTS